MPLKTLPAQNNLRFSRDYLLRAVGISRSQLSAWERAGLIGKTVGSTARRKDGGAANYSHADLVTLKTLLRLRKGGVPARRLRAIHDVLKQRFSAIGVRNPFSELKLTEQDRRVLVSFQGTRMEPITGQLLLDYHGPAQSKSSAIAFRRKGDSTATPSSQEKARRELALKRAERFFLGGLRYEQSPQSIPKAIRAYRRAIELNPQALGALLNLGTLYYNLGRLDEAEQCYVAALRLNPQSALAHFNMGNLADEKGQPELAIQHYERAIAIDARYPDPRYNLALVYEKLGRHGQAWKNWKGYLKLDPDSKWAALARNKLAQQPWQLHASTPNTSRGGEGD